MAMKNHARQFETNWLNSIKSKVFLVFIAYCAYNALLDSLVGRLARANLDSPLDHALRESVITPAHRIAGSGGATKCTGTTDNHRLVDLLINGTELEGPNQSRVNDNDCADICTGDKSQGEGPLASSERPNEHHSAPVVGIIAKALDWWSSSRRGALWMGQVEAIRLVRLDAPTLVEAGQPVRLRCIYETRGDKLQSLSWYKNGHEFYRYQPFERRQPVLAFNYTGVNVDLTKSKNSTVFLTNTTSETSGRYRCEATATTFQEVNLDTYVTVLEPASGSAEKSGTRTSGHILGALLITLICMFIS